MTVQGVRKLEKALSARFVETVAEPGKYFDGQGLFLRVAKNGARQWVQRITIRGKRCELGLGSPPAVTLAVARKLALENRGKAMLGGDPLAERRKAKARPLTFRECVKLYADAKLSEIKSDKHRKQWLSSIERLAMPSLGEMPVRDIGNDDVLRMLKPHWWERTATAKKLRGRVEAILTWATVSGFREGENPAAWKGNLKELLPAPNMVSKTEHQPAVAVREVARWWADLAQRGGMAAQALRFLALTGTRSGTVRLATWDEIDLSSGVWTIPPGRELSKIPQDGNPHRVPMQAEAIAILRELPRLNSCHYVFFAPEGGALSDMSLSAVMRRIHEADLKDGGSGYFDPQSKRRAVPHGLRSTFRQWAAERGYPREMAELAIMHTIGSELERTYQRADMLERRGEMMADWSAFLRGEVQNTANVVALGASK